MSSTNVPDVGHRIRARLESGSRPGALVDALVAEIVAGLGPAELLGFHLDPAVQGEGGVFELQLAEWWPPATGRDELVWIVRAGAQGALRTAGSLRMRLSGVAPATVGVTRDLVAPEMHPGLTLGTTHETLVTVTAELTTAHVEGATPVLATPSMLGLMEMAAQELVADHLAPGHTTVGAHLDVSHLRPSFLDEQVTVRATLVGMARRRLTFAVSAVVADRLLGQGRHQSHVVPLGGLDVSSGRRAAS